MVAERECRWGKTWPREKTKNEKKKRMNMNTNRKREKGCMCEVVVKYTIHLARLTAWKLRKMSRVKQRILISLFNSSWKTSSRFGFLSSGKQFEQSLCLVNVCHESRSCGSDQWPTACTRKSATNLCSFFFFSCFSWSQLFRCLS